jgi:tungstate transport system substrate-binding protein
MADTGFWEAISERFEQASGIHVEVVASGNKDGIAPIFKQGGVDLLTMHSSDAIINLVADGYARDPQPWAKNDFVIVGPADDPAKIKGMTDAAEALRKIVESKSELIIHSSLGAQEVLRNILEPADIELDPDHTTALVEDRQRRVMHIAAEKKAYTLVGRIPFLSGKIPNEGMVAMVAGDVRLRRPFLVVTADAKKIRDIHVVEAEALRDCLRSPQAQAFITEFGKGKYDSRSLFLTIY